MCLLRHCFSHYTEYLYPQLKRTCPPYSLTTLNTPPLFFHYSVIRLCPPKTCSLDSGPTDLLKKTVGVHVPYLVAIVNNSFKQGLFPITLRTAIVKPLLKSDTLAKDLLKNYRPVSNIAFVGKVDLRENCSSSFA